jgi:dissimilatory sulfite reductase (desulfoviridin) alpha/beta subunit
MATDKLAQEFTKFLQHAIKTRCFLETHVKTPLPPDSLTETEILKCLADVRESKWASGYDAGDYHFVQRQYIAWLERRLEEANEMIERLLEDDTARPLPYFADPKFMNPGTTPAKPQED